MLTDLAATATSRHLSRHHHHIRFESRLGRTPDALRETPPVRQMLYTLSTIVDLMDAYNAVYVEYFACVRTALVDLVATTRPHV